MIRIRAASLLAGLALLAACSLPTATGNSPTETSTSPNPLLPTRTSAATRTGESGAATIPTDSLVAYYPFDGDAADASGNGNDGQVFGASAAQDRFRVPDQAYQFDGQNDFILVPESESFGLNGDFSVALWLRPAAPDFFGPILSRVAQRQSKFEGWDLQFDSKYLGRKVIYDPVSSATYISAGLMMTKGQIASSVWTCLAFTYHASDHAWAFYSQGRLNNHGTEGEETVVLNPSARLYIGGDPQYSVYFNGSLDDIAIYQRTLGVEDVRQYCDAGSPAQPATGPTPTLAAQPASSSTARAQPTSSSTATRTRTPTGTPTVQRTPGCDGGFSQLAIGVYAILTEGTVPNRVRSAPQAGDNVISLLYTGTTVKVLGGPVCADGLIFWKVESTTIPGGSGWTAEGDGHEYYLAPYEP
jgi:hypothetical protein